MVVRNKIQTVLRELNIGDYKLSNVSVSAYFEYNGVFFRISDHLQKHGKSCDIDIVVSEKETPQSIIEKITKTQAK